MRDEDKPFICYRKGKWSMHIVPRNRFGWWALAGWVVGLLALTLGIIWAIVSTLGETTLATLLIGAGVIGISLVWTIAMIRWMLARSEVINLDDVAAFKREQDRARRRKR
jgi:IMP dehydrogenase/GMP reductase